MPHKKLNQPFVKNRLLLNKLFKFTPIPHALMLLLHCTVSPSYLVGTQLKLIAYRSNFAFPTSNVSVGTLTFIRI